MYRDIKHDLLGGIMNTLRDLVQYNKTFKSIAINSKLFNATSEARLE